MLDARDLAPEIVYELDASDRFTMLNPAWDGFARTNEGEAILASLVVGAELWAFISDPTSRQIYRRLHERVRSRRVGVAFNFRCDAPAWRRLLRLRLEPAARDALRYVVRTLQVQHREPVALPAASTAGPLLVMCSWCKRIEAEGAMREVEEAVDILNLFEQQPVPMITHGICPQCERTMLDRLDADDWTAGGELTFGPLEDRAPEG